MLSSIKKLALRNSLELKLRRCKGLRLQEFLAVLLSKVHGENFVAGGTDYSRGDLKCDGLLREPLTIFACYGPVNSGDHMTDGSMRTAVAKVKSDFEGARAEWPSLKEWVFVTNYLDTPAQLTQEILRLQAGNPDLKLRMFGRKQFEDMIFGLAEDDINELLGPDATEEDFRAIQPQEILAVVRAVMVKPAMRREDEDEPVVVPFGKLQFNGLEKAYKDRIANGFKNARSVEKLVGESLDPLLESTLASIYRAKYLELEAQGLAPGDIMDELYEYTLSGERATTPREVAVWSVLAYFFEKCTIFKDSPVVSDPAEEAAA